MGSGFSALPLMFFRSCICHDDVNGLEVPAEYVTPHMPLADA